MAKIGIFFGTDTGRTRRVAKSIAKALGELAAEPVNVNRASPEQFLGHDALILGTPTLGEGELPGLDTGAQTESWAEFLPRVADADLSGKRVAIFGLGDQQKYAHAFCDAMALLHDALVERGARVVGAWPTEGYEFKASLAAADGHFVGLALDQHSQPALTDARLEGWLAQILPELAP